MRSKVDPIRTSARAPGSVDRRSPVVTGRVRSASIHSPRDGLNCQTWPTTSARRAAWPGERGVIPRRTSPDDLPNLVDDALHGLPLPAIPARSAREDSTPGSIDLLLLSARELEIFRLIGLGQSTKAIAALLGISEKTVSAHRENIKLKLGIHRAAALTLIASSHAHWEAIGADHFE
jgi:DNA-binding CsgD family transcriptional regulator